MPKIVLLHYCYIASRSRSGVGFEIMDQGQRSRSNVNFGGSSLPSAAKSNIHNYQSKVIVCVSVICGRMLIIAQMRSIGF